MKLHLRDYQMQGVVALRQAYKGGYRAPLYCLPTGGGKTAIFSYITESVARRGKRVVILAHRQELVSQSSAHLREIGVEHGVISPRYTATSDPVQVASVQTLVRRLDRLSEPDLVILDEAHHAAASQWVKIRNAWQNAKLLGVTATPARLDGKGLAPPFDILIEGPSIRWLIDNGYLVQPVVYAPSAPDLTGMRTKNGDFRPSELRARIVADNTIVGDAVAHYGRICPGVPAIAFCVSVEHAEKVAAEFREAGWHALSVDGSMHDNQRRARIEGLRDGRVHVLTSCELISEGTDIPVCGAAILLRPTQSLTLFLQAIGRALRPAPDKNEAVILDHAGNSLRHGMPDQERAWSLAEGVVVRKADDQNAPSPKQCPRCFHVHRGGPTCPKCGHDYESSRQLHQVGGDLVRLNAAEFAAIDQQVKKQRKRLQQIADKKGYNPKWVDHVLRERRDRAIAEAMQPKRRAS